MYSAPANFLEIDVINPQTTIIAGKKKFTDYEIKMRVSYFIIHPALLLLCLQRTLSALSLSFLLHSVFNNES